jgi:hypothetical protein
MSTKGIWIPIDILRDKELTMQEKLILMEINQLCELDTKSCYASNLHFSKLINVSEKSVSNTISSLIKKGKITSVLSDRNHKRLLSIKDGYTSIKDGESKENKTTKLEIKNLQAFDKLWKDYTLTFLKGFNRGGGSKKKALDGYKTLVKKYSDEEIYGYVENHAGLDFGHKDLERLLKLDLIKQYFEDERS